MQHGVGFLFWGFGGGAAMRMRVRARGWVGLFACLGVSWLVGWDDRRVFGLI